MITKSKQTWNINSIVNVGFLTLKVTRIEAIRDSLPDIYYLESLNGTKQYQFIPHNGLTRIN